MTLRQLLQQTGDEYGDARIVNVASQIHCATSPDAEGGHYYVNCEIGEASDQSRDKQAAERLWHETNQWISGL